MLKLIISTCLILMFAAAALAQDPAKVDSNHYKVEFENDQVRVLRIKVGPKEKSIMHQHPNAVAIFMTDVNGKFTFPDGKSEDSVRKAGDVLWTPATTHLPENVGEQPFEVILVELKQKTMMKKAMKVSHHSARMKR
jgi:quercetin dioxygenase-like cupin family protein